MGITSKAHSLYLSLTYRMPLEKTWHIPKVRYGLWGQLNLVSHKHLACRHLDIKKIREPALNERSSIGTDIKEAPSVCVVYGWQATRSPAPIGLKDKRPLILVGSETTLGLCHRGARNFLETWMVELVNIWWWHSSCLKECGHRTFIQLLLPCMTSRFT